MYVVLVYDIRLDEKGNRVLRKVFNTCKKYLVHIQNSVFEGELSKGQLRALDTEVKYYIRKDMDSLIIFKSEQEKWLEKEFWGKREDMTDNFL